MTNAAPPPMVSVGVPTYRRHALLRECLSSILAGCRSLEVLVGNDFTGEVLTGETIGVTDGRVRYINHPINLGARRNHDTLLRAGRGRYFTWLADDDLHAPAFLETVHDALRAHRGVPCVFTSYAIGPAYEPPAAPSGHGELLDGREFLSRYLTGRIKVVGCYGVFERARLLDLGGFQQFGDGFSPYADNLLAVKAAALERIVFVDAPLVFVRAHDESASWTSGDLAVYRRAQEYWCDHSLPVLSQPSLRPDREVNLLRILRWCVRDYSAVARRAPRVGAAELGHYLAFVNRYAAQLRPVWRAHVTGAAIRALGRVLVARGRDARRADH